MIKNIWLLAGCLLSLVAHAQHPQGVSLDNSYLQQLQKNIVSRNDSTDLYVNDGTSKDLLYYALVPQGVVKGVIVLLPGAWEQVETVLSSNKALCQQAYSRQLAVIVPSINRRLALDKEVLDFLNTVLLDSIKRYRLPAGKFILGGFSVGGLFSLRYTELAYMDVTQTAIRPLAVYSVDGPMDLAHLYESGRRGTEKNPPSQEGIYITTEFKKIMGGTPAEARQQYEFYAAYSRENEQGGNIRYLTKVPVRIYNDTDVNWWIQNRSVDLYDMNALDQSAAINWLRQHGNTQADFINAFGKGYRPDGSRHPHSWSIVDAKECVDWICSIVGG
ncbi:hypothetical protein [Chitinophaga sp. HK235]|uniref:hypothetical protein n=1 Tax=Chitinophaga sp. HK235 TaxID=2952571 RepID=UPI001BA7C9EE|nr:hypothetical protein [Chitinophaga sp. HK235]